MGWILTLTTVGNLSITRYLVKAANFGVVEKCVK